MATDPICGMYVDDRDAILKVVRENRTYYFCSTSCVEAFTAPGRELARLKRQLAVGWSIAILVVALTYVWHPAGWMYYAAAAATVSQVYVGYPFYRGTWDAIRSRIGNMDILIAVGTTVAYGYSLAALLFPSALPAAYYFDASTLILALLLTGNYLERRTRDRASGAVRRLQEMLPSRVRRVRPAGDEEIARDELAIGDLARVRPGERVPVDGTIVEGRTEVDESLLTGESLPAPRGPGGKLLAGSVNGTGSVVLRTEQLGADLFVAQIGQLLAEAETSRVPLQRLADRIAALFVPAVLALAVVAAAVWYATGAGPTVALLIFVSVVITACPCAFGLATPAAILAGTGRAAEEGILFRGHDAIESSARVDLVLSDKTGTLTTGEAEVAEIRPEPGTTPEEALSLAAGLERGSEHPFARAIVRAAEGRGITAAPVTDVTAMPGSGIRGRLRAEEIRIAWDDRNSGAEEPSEPQSWSRLTLGSRTVARFGFCDRPRSDAAWAVRELAAEGIETVMVTGDRTGPAQVVAAGTGIAVVHAGVTPAQKLEILEGYRRSGRAVAFVGDGINDAAALAAADAGIALGTGTDVAKEAGKVLLVRSELAKVPRALDLARRTVRKVRQNLLWALGYNAFLLPIAAGALVPWLGFGIVGILPITGAIAMGASSTLVLANSMTLRWSRAPRTATVHTNR